MNTSPRVLLVKFDKPPGGILHVSYSEPIGICYLAAYLRKNGITSRLCHLFRESAHEDLRKAILDYEPSVIGFSLRAFNYPITVSHIEKVRHEFPGIRIVIGGECVTEQNAIHIATETVADLATIGDAESAFLRYVSGIDPRFIPNVVYRTLDGKYHQTVGPTECILVSELPMMVREGLPMERYESDGFPGKKYASMHVQRGCRFNCAFCNSAGRYKSVHSRTVDQILEEIDFLVDLHHIEALAIWDEDFFADVERVRGIVTGLKQRGNPFLWHTFMKLTDLERRGVVELLPHLRRTGYVRAIIGIESFLPSTLKTYQKARRNNIEDLCRRLTDNDIVLCPTYIIGEPNEECDEVAYGLERLLLLRDAHGIKMDMPYVSFITPFPGTRICEAYEKKGLIIDNNWSHYDGETVIVRGNCPPEKLIELRDSFYDKFNRIKTEP